MQDALPRQLPDQLEPGNSSARGLLTDIGAFGQPSMFAAFGLPARL
jgi:hypothetical protein